MRQNVDRINLYSRFDYQGRENKHVAMKTKNMELNRPIAMNANSILRCAGYSPGRPNHQGPQLVFHDSE